jgi:large subunit ribosomal protein L37e
MPSKQAIHHGKRIHIQCRRCGRRAYHVVKKVCAACGYGGTARLRRLAVSRKDLQRTRRIV